MPFYIVTRKTDGVEVTRYAASGPAVVNGFGFADHDHTEFDPNAGVVPAPPPSRITKLAFRNRFTAAEKSALEIASLHNHSLAENHQSNVRAASLRVFMADQRDAQFIDLGQADTRNGVARLEQLGLLAAGRAAVILDTPPAPSEVWSA